MPTDLEQRRRRRLQLLQGQQQTDLSLPGLTQSVLPASSVTAPGRVSSGSLSVPLLPPSLHVRPPLASIGFRDPRLPASARRSLRQSERINRRLERRAAAQGLKIPDEHDKGNWANFLELVDNLNRPQSAIFNVVRGIQQGLPAEQLLDNLTQGFSFEERATFSDLLEAGGMDHPSRLRTMLGFAGDVVLDPINIVPGYLLLAPLKLAGKGARRVRVLSEMLDAAAVSAPIKRLRQTFISSTGNVLLDAARKMSINLERAEESKLFQAIGEMDNKYRRQLGALYERVPAMAERPKVFSSFSRMRKAIRKSNGRNITREEFELLRDASRDFRKLVDGIEDLERVHGIKVPTLSDQIHKEMAKLEKRRKKALIKKREKILKKRGQKLTKLQGAMREALDGAPDEIKDEFIAYVTGKIPAKVGTRAVRGADGKFISEPTGKFVFDVEGMQRKAADFVRGKIDNELAALDSELDTLARQGQFIGINIPDIGADVTRQIVDPTTGKSIRGKALQSFEEPVIALLERLREGRFGAYRGNLVGTGLPLFGQQGDSLARGFREALGSKLSVRQVRARLREAINAYATGQVSEDILKRWLNLWVGPGGAELTNFTAIISRIKARRAAVEKFVNARGNVDETIEFVTKSILEGTYTPDEILDFFKTPSLAQKTGIRAYVKELGKRWDDVQFALRGGREIDPLDVLPGTAEAARLVRRPFFSSIGEIPRYVEDLLEDFVRGELEIDEVVDLLGEKGTPGRETLRKAVKKVQDSQTAIDALENLTRGRLQSAEEALQRRYGPRAAQLREMLARVPAYVPHVLSAEAVEQIVDSGTNILKRVNTEKHASLLWRRFSEKGLRPLDFDEVQALLTDGEKAILNGKRLVKPESFAQKVKRIIKADPEEAGRLFSMDPKTILATRALRAAKAVGSAQFLDDMARDFGTLVPRASEKAARKAAQSGGQLGLDLSAGKVRIDAPGFERLADHVFDPEIADEITRVWKTAYGSDEGVNSIIRAWDTMTNYWKVWTLGIFGGYHFRNIIGSGWNMHLGGMFEANNFDESIYSMVSAGQVQRWAGQRNTDMLKRWTLDINVLRDDAFGTTTIDGNAFVRMLREYGIIDEGFFAVEAGGAFRGDPTANFGDLPFVRRIAGKDEPFLPTGEDLRNFASRAVGRRGVSESLIGAEGAITRTGVLVGRAIENQMKASFFLFKLRQGFTPKEAMLETAKYLFDYRDITQAEHLIKKAIPFYVWTRKNIPLQLEALIRQPHKFARIPEAGRAVTGVVNPEFAFETDMAPEEDIPRWIAESSPVPLRRTHDGQMEFFLFKNWLPASDIDDILSLNRLNRMAFSMIHPLPKVLIENQTGKNVFFDADLNGQGEFLGRQMDRKTINLLRVSRVLNEFDQLDPFGTFRKTRERGSTFNRVNRVLTGLRPSIASPERERLSRVTRRREQLQAVVNLPKRQARLERLKAQGII